MPGLYEERYSGFRVKHLHNQLQQRHSYKLGYTATRYSLQIDRAVKPAKRSARRGARCFANSIPTGAVINFLTPKG
jgi:hypothetical protein